MEDSPGKCFSVAVAEQNEGRQTSIWFYILCVMIIILLFWLCVCCICACARACRKRLVNMNFKTDILFYNIELTHYYCL